MAEEDRSDLNPLGEDAPPSRGGGNQEGHVLPEVVRGRLLCVTHGRMCYRRISRVGIGEWICPDERHLTPIAGS
jgi:hypothetical protein